MTTASSPAGHRDAASLRPSRAVVVLGAAIAVLRRLPRAASG